MNCDTVSRGEGGTHIDVRRKILRFKHVRISMDRGQLFKSFQDIVLDRHEYAKRWKAKTQGRVIGYFCTYVPEEIVLAANMLPVRIIGSHQSQSVTDELCSRNKWCAFSRNCLAEGLLGKYDYLDGLVIGASCFHTQQVFASWIKHVPVSYWHSLYIPGYLQGALAEDCLTKEFEEFKESLEAWTGKTIAIEAIDQSIDTYNRSRQLMKEIYALRKSEPPLLSGAEAMEMVLASQVMDKSEHNEMLKQVIAELPSYKSSISPGVRLMVIGSENDDIEIVRDIESLGANIIIDDHCVGSRYFWGEIIPKEDRFRALANRYAQRPPCPTKDFPERRRLDHILNLAKDYHVQAAILILQRFCEPHEYDIPSIEAALKKLDIPTLVIELDIPMSLGQVRNRVESLLEMIRLEP